MRRQRRRGERALSRAGWRALHGALVLVVAVAAWTPGADAPSLGFSDKLDHIAAFAVLAATAAAGWPARARHLAGIALWLLIYGVLIEVVQTTVPGRHGDIVDVLADGVGIVVGLAAAALARRLRTGPGDLDPPR